jgi:hypothetical protein
MGIAGMTIFRRITRTVAALGLLVCATQGAFGQVQTIDPNAVIDSDLNSAGQAPAPAPMATPVAPPTSYPELPAAAAPVTAATPSPSFGAPAAGAAQPNSATGQTYHQDDLIGAAEGVFGKGARGLALMIKDILHKQGEPNAYITGREGGGAVVVGLRYGSGTLHHKIEGELPVYWTGPSVGFDFGANAGNTFVLVYNLHDSEELFKRFGAGEGQAYLVGGFNVSYLRRGDIVLIPVRMGAGLRLGVNAGYMKFSHSQKWMPF